ncbi:unnamed protein product [Pneumocystis jirovecii]|uniref:G-patch domain-containing protein n=1 Tax=Pneumocystis jirovecii TaxID=42068 RepID=L0PBZ1_PNEJI|nr:unnamed protein product [Pneumocystis jirovecii]
MDLSRKKPRIEEDKQDYIFFGTSIVGSEGIEEGKYEPIWKQEVRDERGRRRLHGAFTGGFSAGYYNTVGSKEGWTPQSFRSSRKERAVLKVGRVEDYMDSEDFAEREEERRLKTRDDFIGIGSENINQEIKRKSIGVRLLKKMGWKEGQGVGPLIKKTKVQGDDGEVEDEYASKFLFACKDFVLEPLKNKTDLYGLGYVPSPGIERPQNIKNTSTPKFGISGISFGYGVLNEDDNEYDHEVYDFGPSKIKYDTVLDHEEKGTSTSTKFKPVTKHLFVPRKKNSTSVEVKRCQDGTLPLNGFIIAEVYRLEKKTWFEPPVVPPDYVPSAPHSKKTKTFGGALQPRDRGAILGETPLLGKSVFDFLSPSARERVVQATGKTDLPPARNEGSILCSTLKADSPLIDKKTALDALNNKFMPYEDNEEKRKRYIIFLQEHAGIIQRGSYENIAASRDYQKEVDEFVKSARIFKPMTGMMKSRFTTSSTSSPVSVVDNSLEGGIIDLPIKEVNAAEEAAKMNMFGSLTRIIIPFYPARLLCKRFNVRNPYPDKPTTSDINDKPKNELVDKSIIEGIMREVKGDQTYVLPEKRQENLNIDDTTNEALEKERPNMDVFTSIFGDDDDL